MGVGNEDAPATPQAILLAEWQEARKQIDALDTLLSGLRKNGFAFITALLAADSIIGQATGQASIVLSPQVKLGVMVTTLVLIVGQYATDRFYTILQQAFAKAASEIERGWIKNKDLHLEQPGPTMVVGLVYEEKHGWVFVDALYLMFGVADLVLGYFILQPDTMNLFPWLVVAGLLVLAVGAVLMHLARGRHEKLKNLDLKSMM